MSQDGPFDTNGIPLCLTVFSKQQYTVGNVSYQYKLIWDVLKWSLTSDSEETRKKMQKCCFCHQVLHATDFPNSTSNPYSMRDLYLCNLLLFKLLLMEQK